MPDTKLSDLTAVPGLLDTDELLLARAGESKKITGEHLTASVSASGSAWTFLTAVELEFAGAITLDLTTHQSYNDLMIVLMARGTHATGHETLTLRFNGDTGSNYFREGAYFSGTAAATMSEDLAQSRLPVGVIPSTSDTADFFSATEIFIPAYSKTIKKLVKYNAHSYFSLSAGGSEYCYGGGLWNNTAAITAIAAQGLNTANLAIDSIARVYGRT